MANRWLFAGGDTGCIDPVGTPPTHSTTTTHRRTANTDVAIYQNGAAQSYYVNFFDAAGAQDFVSTGETLWYSCYIYYQDGGGSGDKTSPFTFYDDDTGFPWLRLTPNATTDEARMQYNSGSGASPVWTDVGTSFPFADGAARWIVFKITLGSPNSVEVYVDDALVSASADFTQASLTRLGQVLHNAPFRCYCSEIMATAGISLVNGRLETDRPSGAGSNSGWTGAFTAIDEAVISDADFITSDTDAAKSTFAYSDLSTVASGFVLGDVFLWTRGRINGGSLVSLKPVRRTSGGVDDVGTAFSGVSGSFGDFPARYSGLTAAEFNASEFGVQGNS